MENCDDVSYVGARVGEGDGERLRDDFKREFDPSRTRESDGESSDCWSASDGLNVRAVGAVVGRRKEWGRSLEQPMSVKAEQRVIVRICNSLVFVQEF